MGIRMPGVGFSEGLLIFRGARWRIFFPINWCGCVCDSPGRSLNLLFSRSVIMLWLMVAMVSIIIRH